jgi:glycosyltransferase involved in cell wall biosynthesis
MRIGIDARKISDFGIGTYVRGLLRGLATVRESETYVVFAPAEAAKFLPHGFEYVELNTPHYSVRELIAVGRAANRARIDLLHVPHYVVPVVRGPVVTTIHDLIHLRMPHRNPLKPLYARAMLRRAVSRSSHVLTVSAAVREDIIQTLYGRPERITVTPNGVDDVFRASAPRASPGSYFLYAGNDKPHKNVDHLVEAFSIVRASHPRLSLILAGAPFERHHAREGIVAAGFLSTSELAALYRSAIAVVQPSSDEGFGLPAAEAMASGTAVITSRAPALVEVTGDAALHVDVATFDELVTAIARLATDDALRVALARRGIERARDLTWSRCAAMTRNVYSAVLSRS